MRLPSEPPPPAPRPLMARLSAPAGPPPSRVIERGDAQVMAVPGRYSVTYLILGPDAIAAVDVGSAADVPGILDALAWLGRRPEDLRTIIPTHLHFDHAMGIDALARRVGAEVALGEVAHAHVAGAQPLRFPPLWQLSRAVVTWFMQGSPFPPLADWRHGMDFGMPWGRNRFTAALAPVLSDGAAIPGLAGWTALATPGHADDAICLYHEAGGLLITGDTVRNFIRGEWNPLLGDEGAYARTREKLRRLPVQIVLPAHGPAVEGPDVMRRIWQAPVYVP